MLTQTNSRQVCCFVCWSDKHVSFTLCDADDTSHITKETGRNCKHWRAVGSLLFFCRRSNKSVSFALCDAHDSSHITKETGRGCKHWRAVGSLIACRCFLCSLNQTLQGKRFVQRTFFHSQLARRTTRLILQREREKCASRSWRGG